MKKNTILVLGASGFIGKNIAQRLSKRKDVIVYGTYLTNKPEIKNITLIKADLRKEREVDRIIAGKDIVIQAAAVTSGAKDILSKPYIHVTDNAIMNSLIFKSCFTNGVKHVVFFSCTVMYPNKNAPVKEKDFNYQITEKYFGVGWTKVYLEKMCEFYSKLGNTKYTAIRHSNMYGPHDKYDLEKSHFFGATITKVLTAKDDLANGAAGKINVWGDGSEKRDLLYISDLVDFVEIIIKKQKEQFELINIGFGQAVSVKEVIKKIIKISKKKLQIEFDTSKPTIRFNLSVNSEKAINKYKWKPRVSLEKKKKKTIEWYNKTFYEKQ